MKVNNHLSDEKALTCPCWEEILQWLCHQEPEVVGGLFQTSPFDRSCKSGLDAGLEPAASSGQLIEDVHPVMSGYFHSRSLPNKVKRND